VGDSRRTLQLLLPRLEKKLKQGYELAKALARGQPAAGKIVATMLEDKVKEMI
jgi:hypothetical protein